MSETVTPYRDTAAAKKEQVATMFDNISGRYDFLNHFLSLGIDTIWRKKAIRSLKKLQPMRVLDVATGTGDFAFETLRILKPEKIIGVDISAGMLDVAREKIARRGVQDSIELILGDSEGLPFDHDSFDAVTVAFGVRNFEHLQQGINDMYRVLRPGGQAVILEFSRPRIFPVKQLYNFYFNVITPFIGRVFSKDARAYSDLPESVAKFPDGKDFEGVMQRAGFRQTVSRPQTFGICTIYTGVK